MNHAAAARRHQIAKCVNDIHDRVMGSTSSSYPNWSVTCVTAVARQLLLKGAFFKDGSQWRYKSKSLGCGVQEVKIIEV
jgi:hypothetical protein